MTAKELAELIGEADEKYILEAVPRKRVPMWKIVLPMAAAVTLMIAAGGFWLLGPYGPLSKKKSDISFAKSGDAAAETAAACLAMDGVTMEEIWAEETAAGEINYAAEPDTKALSANGVEVDGGVNEAAEDEAESDAALSEAMALDQVSTGVYYSVSFADDGTATLYLTFDKFTEGCLLTLTSTGNGGEFSTFTLNEAEIAEQAGERIVLRSLWSGDPAENAPEIWLEFPGGKFDISGTFEDGDGENRSEDFSVHFYE